jgi:hypothetical protein
MKKIKLAALILLTVFLNGIVNAQKKTTAAAATPSKEETMNWIADKMKENLVSPRKFVSYNAGIFVFSRELYDGKNTVCTLTIDLNKVTGMSNEYSNDFYISGKEFNNASCTDGKKRVYDFLSISGPDYNDYGAPFNFTPDQSLVERLKKAFASLIKYNSTAKSDKEAY